MLLFLVIVPLCCLSLPIDDPQLVIENPNILEQPINDHKLLWQPSDTRKLPRQPNDKPKHLGQLRDNPSLLIQPIENLEVLRQPNENTKLLVQPIKNPNHQQQPIDNFIKQSVNHPKFPRQPKQVIENPHFPRQPKLGESPFFVVSENVSSLEYDALVSDLVGVPLGEDDLMDPGSREQLLNQVKYK